MSFKSYQRVTRPPWLLGPVGTEWSDGTAAPKDELAADATSAVKCRMPTLAPWDALALLGSERGVRRGPHETDEQYAQRVLDAWTLKQAVGTAFGILREFWDMGYRGMHVLTVLGDHFSLDANGALVSERLNPGSWAIDATPRIWSKFQVLFAYPHPWVSSGMPASDSAEVKQLRQIVEDMAPAFATSGGIVVQTSAGNLWGWPPSGRTLGNWGTGKTTWGSGNSTVTIW